jgi:hypothetical protein
MQLHRFVDRVFNNADSLLQQDKIKNQGAGNVNVVSCKLNPTSIILGGRSNPTVSIDEPAPECGVGVTIGSVFNGSEQTLLNTPATLGFSAGKSTYVYPLKTQISENAATKITFSAHIGAGTVKTAELHISRAHR